MPQRSSSPEPPPVDGARWIPLTRGRFALVDDDDYEAAIELGLWSFVRTETHAAVRLSRRHDYGRYLHRIIVGWMLGRPVPRRVQVDHRSGDTLDCRRENLRLSTPGQNTANRRVTLARSGYRGVFWEESCSMWRARIRVNYRQLSLGYFHDPIEAAKVRDDAARSFFGEFARLNFPTETELRALTPQEFSRSRAIDNKAAA